MPLQMRENLVGTSQEPVRVGWREWVSLPGLGIAVIKAKLDTGARTSALHAFAVERYVERGAPYVRVGIHPRQGCTRTTHWCEAPVIDERWVTNSGGQREKRIVIETELLMGAMSWKVEVTITDRDPLRFRMLLGRTAMNGRVLIDPSASYLLGTRDIVRRRGLAYAGRIADST
jgi:hypothetical protein